MAEEKAKKEKTKRINCTACNKSMKKVKRYYRNGKHFCNKNCFKAFIKKESEGKK